VEIHCDFCGQRYTFDPVDAAQLFTAPVATGAGEGAQQQH
jgi:molecular chaperone Hsp33